MENLTECQIEIKKIREATGMNRKEFCEHFNIPYRTVTEWERGTRNAADVVRNWLRNRATLEYLSTWEEIYNPNFKVFESEHFKKQAGLLTFTPSISEWVEQTNAIGLYVKKGKYDGINI